MNVKKFLDLLRTRLGKLSFRTGLVVAFVCLCCYIVSFAQMALPIPVWMKTVLWVVFYGLAKAAQYTAILILGKEGIRRLKGFFVNRGACRP